MLSEIEFEILLDSLENENYRKKDIIFHSLIDEETRKRCVVRLEEEGLLSGKEITENGKKALEPYRVKNAIIMAAGMSSRFAPLSYEKPKALLKVKGEVLVEREIRQLQEAGIHDITLVVGYMKEKMFYLGDKYGVNIIVNEEYYHYNNTSTLMCVLGNIGNTYICSSDNYFVENPFEAYVYNSYYAAEYSVDKTDEYCMEYDDNGIITDVQHGGSAAWYMVGHSYWNNDFATKFSSILLREYENVQTKHGLWEDLYIRYISELKLSIRKYKDGVIKEFDSLDELREFDDYYLVNSNSKIFDNICTVLKCEMDEITDIVPIKAGLTNLSFRFEVGEKRFVYRHPGKGTEAYINRMAEAESMRLAKELNLDDTFIYIDPEEGWKISYYIEDAQTLDYHDDIRVKEALSMLRKLHLSGRNNEQIFDLQDETKKFIHMIRGTERADFEDMQLLEEKIELLYQLVADDKVEKCICHCDSYDPNFLIDKEGKMYLIDWEYSGMVDPGTDVGTFIACSDYTMDEADEIISLYLGHEPSVDEKRHYIAYVAFSAYYWFVWALYQESVGKNVGEYLYMWYNYTKQYSNKAIELYGGNVK